MSLLARSINLLIKNLSGQKLFVSSLIGIVTAIIVGFLPIYIQKNREEFPPDTIQTSLSSPIPTISIIPHIETLDKDKILKNNYNQNREAIESLPQQQVTSIWLGGDVLLGRSIGFNMTRLRSFEYPLVKIAQELREADLVIVNLENPIVNDCPITTEGMIFCSSPGTLGALTSAGIDIVNVANNHILNYGPAGLSNTLLQLDAVKIKHFGSIYQPTITDVRGTKIGFLGFSYFGGEPYLPSTNILEVKNQIMSLKSKVDLVYVSFHWGEEYQNQPKIWQRLVAYQAVESGADVVFGHHPHWVQGFEMYNNKPIFYSLGNLVFDQEWSQSTREGLVVETLWWQKKLVGVYFHPVFMENLGQPSWQTVGYGNLTLAKIENLSNSLEDSQSAVLQQRGQD